MKGISLSAICSTCLREGMCLTIQKKPRDRASINTPSAGRTPSSERRRINLVIVVVSQKIPEIKIITVMWRDEVMRGR